MKQAIKLSFTTQKGGAGKSTFTVLAASYLHYLHNRNVAIVDADYPQNSIAEMRNRDLKQVMSDELLKQKAKQQFIQLGKKGYPVMESRPEDAISDGNELMAEYSLDYIFYDLPGTMNNTEVIKTLSEMDYLFVPISADRVELESTLQQIILLQNGLISTGKSKIKGIYPFWNRVDGREKTELYAIYEDVIAKLGLPIMQTRIPDSKRFRKEQEFQGRGVFRSTLFPPDRQLLRGSNMEELIQEITQITQL
ncbi:MAG: ParA family protein [Mangrovibacterium sp.]